MAGERSNGQSSELVYLPRASWYPPVLAAGLAAILASFFTWWPYGAVGAIAAIVALLAWIRASREDFDRLPRTQRVATGSLPAPPLKRS